MATDQREVQFPLDELGKRWGPVLNQAFAEIVILQKNLSVSLAKCASLSQELERVKEELHQIQNDGQTILDEAKKIADQVDRIS